MKTFYYTSGRRQGKSFEQLYRMIANEDLKRRELFSEWKNERENAEDDRMIFFKEYMDCGAGDSAIDNLNKDIKNGIGELINTQYQVVHYESINQDRAFILAQWKEKEGIKE